jgi:hypothetical protein
MKQSTKIKNAITCIEAQVAKFGSNLTFTEISELAVAIHELKGFVNSIEESEEVVDKIKEITTHSRAKYQKFIVVGNDNKHYSMKEWVRNNEDKEFREIASKISHEVSRILVTKYSFRKVVDSNNNVILLYQPLIPTSTN